MKKFTKILFVIFIILALTLNCTGVFAAPPDKPSGEMSSQNGGTPPDKPDGDGNVPGGNSSTSNVSHTGATEISSNTTNSGGSYSSTTSSQNALLVTGGTSILSNPTI